MAYNGSGTFVRLYDWTTDKAAGIKIRADRMDEEMDGFATGLSTAITKDGQTTITANLPMNSKKLTGLAAGSAAGDSVRWEQVFAGASLTAEVAVASAATCDILGAASDLIEITGTTTITSLGTGTNKRKFVRFSGALTLTHHATTLILPGGVNITTVAGDTMVVVSDGSSNARVVSYQRAGTTTQRGELEIATAAEWRTGTDTARGLGVAETWGSAAEVTLTDAATIAVDFATFINGVVTLAGNRTLGNPTNEKVGQSGYIRIIQDGTGTRTLAYGSDWEFAGGTAPVLSTTAADQDLLFYQVLAADRVFASLVKDIS